MLHREQTFAGEGDNTCPKKLTWWMRLRLLSPHLTQGQVPEVPSSGHIGAGGQAKEAMHPWESLEVGSWASHVPMPPG